MTTAKNEAFVFMKMKIWWGGGGEGGGIKIGLGESTGGIFPVGEGGG